MKSDNVETGTSLLTVLLITLHQAGDIARGVEPGNLTSLGVLVLIVAVWLSEHYFYRGAGRGMPF